MSNVTSAVFALTSLMQAASPAAGEGTALTIYSTVRPGAIPPEMYQPAMRRAGGMDDSRVQVPGYAFVKQQRKVKLDPGLSTLRFTDVAALVEPTTVMFTSLSDKSGTTVVEQNFEFDLVSPDKLLEKFIDRPITVEFVNPDGKPESVAGVLLGKQYGHLMLRTTDAESPIEILQEAGRRIRLSELPGGLITRPTLVWTLSSKAGGDQLVRVTYQTNGMTWWADYNLVYHEHEKDANAGTFDLGAWVSIINQSGASYADARLKLIAGDVERAQPPQSVYGGGRGRAKLAMAEADVSGFEEKAFFEYHLYTLGRATTLPNNSTKQIELFPAARGVPCEKVYVYYGLAVPWWNYGGNVIQDRELGTQSNTKVDVYLRFVNDEKSGLGMPLPSGRVRVNKLDPADESLEFIGENVIDHTPRNEKVLAKLGSAFDVVGAHKMTDFKIDTGRRRMEESFEIRVRNRKDSAVKVLVKETLYRWSQWEIVKKSHEFEKQDARSVHFPVQVEPDGEAVVTYTVRYEW